MNGADLLEAELWCFMRGFTQKGCFVENHGTLSIAEMGNTVWGVLELSRVFRFGRSAMLPSGQRIITVHVWLS